MSWLCRTLFVNVAEKRILALNNRMTPAQCRAARALIEFSQNDLAASEGWRKHCANFEAGRTIPVKNNLEGFGCAGSRGRRTYCGEWWRTGPVAKFGSFANGSESDVRSQIARQKFPDAAHGVVYKGDVNAHRNDWDRVCRALSGGCFSDFGYFVTCIEKDASKIASLQQGKF